jgi:hypothetical protein
LHTTSIGQSSTFFVDTRHLNARVGPRLHRRTDFAERAFASFLTRSDPLAWQNTALRRVLVFRRSSRSDATHRSRTSSPWIAHRLTVGIVTDLGGRTANLDRHRARLRLWPVRKRQELKTWMSI